jgi:hypothetical protein
MLVPAAAEQHTSLDVLKGLIPGANVSIAPNDTGRDHPTVGTLVIIEVVEVVITPNEKSELDVQLHFLVGVHRRGGGGESVVTCACSADLWSAEGASLAGLSNAVVIPSRSSPTLSIYFGRHSLPYSSGDKNNQTVGPNQQKVVPAQPYPSDQEWSSPS